MRPNLATIADQSFLLALRAWGKGLDAEAHQRLAPEWLDRLDPDRSLSKASGSKPAEAAERLAREARLQRSVDLARVHPSWIVRALRDESPAVRKVVARNAFEPLRSILQRAFDDLSTIDARLDRRPDPASVSLALTLWSERLVGDIPQRDDDAVAVVALTRLGPVELARLVERIGLVKIAALSASSQPELRSRRQEWIVDRLRTPGKAAKSSEALMSSDIASLWRFSERIASGLGLITLGRLAANVDPYRLRWALQHVPYPIARMIRQTSASGNAGKDRVVAWEFGTLRTAIGDLDRQGRRPKALGDFV